MHDHDTSSWVGELRGTTIKDIVVGVGQASIGAPRLLWLRISLFARSQYLEWLQLDMGRCSIVARSQPWLDLENIHQRRTLSGAQCALMNEITPTFLAVRPERKLAKSLGSRERTEWETGWKDDADVNVVSLLADWGWSPLFSFDSLFKLYIKCHFAESISTS